ncbi:MAG: aminopeptidase P family protein [Candidatus Omnitrophica bacterium]|nr:aminopeptidase P family protein [Candidatus Omnitrophota bacterium]
MTMELCTLLNYIKRSALLKAELKKQSLDAFLVTNEKNVSYLSGFTGNDASLLITLSEDFFITDSRYIEEARKGVKYFAIEVARLSNYETISSLVRANKLKRIGFESMNLQYGVVERLKGMIGRSRFTAVKDLVERLRAVKDDGEVALIRDSIRLSRAVLGKVLRLMKPGVSEKFLKRRIETEFIDGGAHAGYEPIVACGKNSSKPHAKATEACIKKNSFVMIDLGCSLNLYNSDLTRMVILGNVREKFKKIYNVVREAQKKALDVIRPGAKISDVDLAARGCIDENGFGGFFGHAVGHGVGLEVHEAPSISRFNNDRLRPGMVFTVEPAIYIPGFGGARLEEMVLVTDDGYEVLTRGDTTCT